MSIVCYFIPNLPRRKVLVISSVLYKHLPFSHSNSYQNFRALELRSQPALVCTWLYNDGVPPNSCYDSSHRFLITSDSNGIAIWEPIKRMSM